METVKALCRSKSPPQEKKPSAGAGVQGAAPPEKMKTTFKIFKKFWNPNLSKFLLQFFLKNIKWFFKRFIYFEKFLKPIWNPLLIFAWKVFEKFSYFFGTDFLSIFIWESFNEISWKLLLKFYENFRYFYVSPLWVFVLFLDLNFFCQISSFNVNLVKPFVQLLSQMAEQNSCKRKKNP